MRRDALIGAVQFYDTAEDDARMVAIVARTAAAHGARIATRARVTRLLRNGDRVTGVEVRDEQSGAAFQARARHVALAAGAWTDELRASSGGHFEMQMRPSKGIHIVVARDRIRMTTGLLSRTEKSVLFVIPTDDCWVIGDTDTPWAHSPDLPVASAANVDYLLAKTNALLAQPLTRADIRGVFAGLRPLVGPAATTDTTRLSRKHVVETSVPGLTTIAGGKYTTYRVMAADLIDAATRELGQVPPSSTETVPLLGAEGFAAALAAAARGELGAQAGLDEAAATRLLRRYGTRIVEILALIGDRPELGAPLPGGEGVLGAEVVHACEYEGALRLEDVLERRTRLAITSADRGLIAAPAAAALMAGPLSWDERRERAEVDAWRRRVAAERAGEAAPDDDSALAAYHAELARDQDSAVAEAAP
jgi:glycerol-3-phosphate dehydrogenase